MSLDLHFYKRKDSPLTEEELAIFLTEHIYFNTSENPDQWIYENPETGVYFTIDHNDPLETAEDIALFDNFDDYTYLNFTFSLNLVRPDFFGLESFPIVDQLIAELDLYVLTEMEEYELPAKYERGELHQLWRSQNHGVILQQFNELRLDYLPVETSNAMWWHLVQREELQESLVEDVFVAGYFILKNDSNGELYTATLWPQHIPVILPPADFVIIQKEYDMNNDRIEETGLVPYESVMTAFEEYFEDFEFEVPGLKILREQEDDVVQEKFNQLEFSSTIEEFGVILNLDEFVNVKP
jgi:hypothetical protein